MHTVKLVWHLFYWKGTHIKIVQLMKSKILF